MITKEQLVKELEGIMHKQGYAYNINCKNIEDNLYNLMVSCHMEGYRKGMEDMRELPF